MYKSSFHPLKLRDLHVLCSFLHSSSRIDFSFSMDTALPRFTKLPISIQSAIGQKATLSCSFKVRNVLRKFLVPEI